jgi:hypothetical protein
MNPTLKNWCLFVLAALPLTESAADSAAAVAPHVQTRCGWFSNPSPNNASLTDRDGEWAIAIQGEFEAKGDWPEFKKSEWVSSGNASYGHGCACMRVVTDKQAHRIISVKSSTAKPLATCRRDKNLKAPKRNDD